MTGRSGQRGISIVELLVVVVMMGLVTVSVMSLFQTSQRQAYTQDEVVEVQQNLRVAMERITRDIRLAGFMIPAAQTPIAQAPNQSLDTNGDRDCSDTGELPGSGGVGCFQLRTASASGRIVRVGTAGTPNYTVTASNGSTTSFNVASIDMSLLFRNDDWVRIIRPPNQTEPYDDAFQIAADPNGTSAQLSLDNFNLTSPTTVTYQSGDVIVRVGGSGVTLPETVTYVLEANGDLRRLVNGTDAEVVASMLDPTAGQGLVFSYLLDNGSEATTVPAANLDEIRAVRVTLRGQTSAQQTGSDNYGTGGVRTRELTQVVTIRNR